MWKLVEPDVSEKLLSSPADQSGDFDKLWDYPRAHRRNLLIDRKFSGTLTSLEETELIGLNEQLSAYMRHLHAPRLEFAKQLLAKVQTKTGQISDNND